MPLTSKGSTIMGSLAKEYGTKKGEQVFYALKAEGKINAVDYDFDQADYNRAKGSRDFKPVRDLSPVEFDKLKALLGEWVEEEKRESEHQKDEWSPEAREAAAKARKGGGGGHGEVPRLGGWKKVGSQWYKKNEGGHLVGPYANGPNRMDPDI